MVFDWDETTGRQLSTIGQRMTCEQWEERYGLASDFTRAMFDLYWDGSGYGAVGFRAMPGWFGNCDASRADWTPERRRHVRAQLVWIAHSCAADANFPHRSMLSGPPNFIADVKQAIPLACAVCPNHPHARQWRDAYMEFLRTWIDTCQRDPDREHNAIGGRWTENIACYSGTSLRATLHADEALHKFDGTDLFGNPRMQAWISWIINAMMSPHYGVRLVPPEGAHSRTYEPNEGRHSHRDSLSEIVTRLQRTAPELGQQLNWVLTNGREGSRPDLKSVLIADYGPVLRHDFGGPHEAYLHLMQIAGPWNYRWGGGDSVLCYGSRGRVWSCNTMEEAGDEWNLDNVTSFTVDGKGLGRRPTDQVLYDFDFAQFYRALGTGESKCRARAMMMLRDDCIVLHDDVDGDAAGQFVWASVLDVPEIYQLRPGVEYVEDTSTEPGALRPGEFPARICNIRRYTGTGDFLTVVAPKALRRRFSLAGLMKRRQKGGGSRCTGPGPRDSFNPIDNHRLCWYYHLLLIRANLSRGAFATAAFASTGKAP